jgi:hypothetical protein
MEFLGSIQLDLTENCSTAVGIVFDDADSHMTF